MNATQPPPDPPVAPCIIELGGWWACSCGHAVQAAGPWLAAHWSEPLQHTCKGCGRVWFMQQGAIYQPPEPATHAAARKRRRKSDAQDFAQTLAHLVQVATTDQRLKDAIKALRGELAKRQQARAAARYRQRHGDRNGA